MHHSNLPGKRPLQSTDHARSPVGLPASGARASRCTARSIPVRPIDLPSESSRPKICSTTSTGTPATAGVVRPKGCGRESPPALWRRYPGDFRPRNGSRDFRRGEFRRKRTPETRRPVPFAAREMAAGRDAPEPRGILRRDRSKPRFAPYRSRPASDSTRSASSGIRPAPRTGRPQRSIGAPTRLPHSVQLPS